MPDSERYEGRRQHFVNKFFEKIIKKVCKLKIKYYLCTRVEQVTVLAHQPIGY